MTKTATAIVLVSAMAVGAVAILVLTLTNAPSVPSQELQNQGKVTKELPKSHLRVWGDQHWDGAVTKELLWITLPQNFNMSIISCFPAGEIVQNYSYTLGAGIQARDRVKLSINATSPIDFQLIFLDYFPKPEQRITYSGGGETIIDKKQITSFDYELSVRKTGIYFFVFTGGTPKPITTVTFDAYKIER